MVKVYFGTNRKPNRKKAPDDFGRDFSADGLANLRFGMAEVTGDELDAADLFLAPEQLREDIKNPILGSRNVFERVRKKMIDHARDTVEIVNNSITVSVSS